MTELHRLSPFCEFFEVISATLSDSPPDLELQTPRLMSRGLTRLLMRPGGDV